MFNSAFPLDSKNDLNVSGSTLLLGRWLVSWNCPQYWLSLVATCSFSPSCVRLRSPRSADMTLLNRSFNSAPDMMDAEAPLEPLLPPLSLPCPPMVVVAVVVVRHKNASKVDSLCVYGGVMTDWMNCITYLQHKYIVMSVEVIFNDFLVFFNLLHKCKSSFFCLSLSLILLNNNKIKNMKNEEEEGRRRRKKERRKRVEDAVRQAGEREGRKEIIM